VALKGRDHILTCNFTKYCPILKLLSPAVVNCGEADITRPQNFTTVATLPYEILQIPPNVKYSGIFNHCFNTNYWVSLLLSFEKWLIFDRPTSINLVSSILGRVYTTNTAEIQQHIICQQIYCILYTTEYKKNENTRAIPRLNYHVIILQYQ